MRVLMVISDLRVGGVETMAVSLAKGLVEAGHELAVASIKQADVLAEAFVSAGAALHRRIARFRFDPAGMLRMRLLIRRFAPDVLIIAGVPRDGMFYGLLGSVRPPRPVTRICWCNSVPGGQTGSFTGRLRGFAALGLIDAIVCVSRRQREILAGRGVPDDKMVIIPNGVDPARFQDATPAALPTPPGQKILIQVANFMPDKDFQTLLRAAAMLAKRRDNFHLVLVGRGTDGPAAMRAIASAGAADVVTPLGRRDDVPNLLAAADVFVLSTHSEVFSVATLEAMAAGKPVITSDIPAFEEMFTPPSEGIRTPAGDAEALAGAIGRVLDDPALARSLGAAAGRRVEQFTRDRMVAQLLRLFDEPAGMTRANTSDQQGY